ncbi:MAG: modification methylase PaeR7I [Candidatus Kapaibacterium thiocyanatum]|uniref:site-specific DNA-methyltransferase (adenine-specific) n=1 Tax=Candidatus Kapaibacterium thiocyanatum TaxID=1895771 RepID=A0A1M3KYG9_9BACT|nr:MAG: modification methylase PaeR7I ['Candidatus Kapabacteria' thiocyanatum]
MPTTNATILDTTKTYGLASETLAAAGNLQERGAVFTRTEVVEFILDLVGYTEDRFLYQQTILEPSFGGGDFLLPIIRRLVRSWRHVRTNTTALDDLSSALVGVELHRSTFELTTTAVINLLVEEGLDISTAKELTTRWLYQGDFLLLPLNDTFDFVVGNPPYIRQERIPPVLLTEYRRRFHTMFDRADIYVAFIERSLTLLKEGGSLGFICADRWMKNRYGGPLRKLIDKNYHLKVYVDMFDTPAFQSSVVAYPAITIFTKQRSGPTRIVHQPEITSETLRMLATALRNEHTAPTNLSIEEIPHISNGAEPWLIQSHDQVSLMKRLERTYPTIEQAGCKVGIGVATGADSVFIAAYDDLDVEDECKIPLVMTKDISSGTVNWRGYGVINPFSPTGGLVDLKHHPRLRAYLEQHKDILLRRHCAQKSRAQWYRTIDRIHPGLTSVPKLLIPDIKGYAHIVYENGTLYPHHNLYYITSKDWNLHALQAVLLSDVVKLVISMYSTKMRGGFLRFQAQHLRRIHVPFWHDVSESLRCRLVQSAQSFDIDACNAAVYELYHLTPDERSAIGGT